MGSTDEVIILKGLIKSRLKEYAYYQLVKDTEMFNYTWGVNKCLFETDIDIYCIYIYIYIYIMDSFFMYWLGFKLGVLYLLCNGG